MRLLYRYATALQNTGEFRIGQWQDYFGLLKTIPRDDYIETKPNIACCLSYINLKPASIMSRIGDSNDIP